MLAMLTSPVMAQSLDNQAFEAKVFHSDADKPMQLAELSAKEMKETEGAWAPLAWAGVALTGARGASFIVRGSQLSRAQAISRLRNGQDVITNSQRYSSQLANSAWGKNNVIRHSAHGNHRSYMPHYQHQSSRQQGHSFWRK